MYDRETDSLWSHLLGEAMKGPLKGSELKQIPSVMTDWKTWRTQHPESTVLWLSRTSHEYRREFYQQPERLPGIWHPLAGTDGGTPVRPEPEKWGCFPD